MNLVSVNIDSIRIGHPLPFSLRDELGVLLASKGFVVERRDDLALIVGRRSQLFVDVAETEAHLRAYQGKLLKMVRQDQLLGDIAEAKISSYDVDRPRDRDDQGRPDWLHLQAQANAMLLDTSPDSFGLRLNKLQTQLSRHTHENPDGTLFALMHLATNDVHLYTATHAMLVAAMCSLAAYQVLKWPTESEVTLCKAALTMNLGMAELQDLVARQKASPSVEQQLETVQLADNSVGLLIQLGVDNPQWLEAVKHHRDKTPGLLANRSEGLRMARLIQRANMFTAGLAPRLTQMPDLAASAMQACYLDENGQPDEAGAALIKAVGIYSPGTFVRLITDEVAVVIKRGSNTSTPRVAVLINRNGMPNGELVVRNTSKREFRIVAAVPHREIKIQVNLEQLLLLT